MKAKRLVSVDGFVPSRRRYDVPEFKAGPSVPQSRTNATPAVNRLAEAVNIKNPKLKEKEDMKSVKDLPPIKLDELSDQTPGRLSTKHRPDKIRSPKKKHNKLVRFIVWALFFALAGGVVYASMYVYKIAQTSNKVFTGGWSGLFSYKPLKTDANGRTNLLVFGTAEDDEGGKHGGANLTDSIMIISFDKENNDMAMLNLPRDLWVKHEKICTVGYQEKINTVYFCASNNGKNESAGAEALMRKVTEVTGVELQYYVHLNFGAVIGLVDAVDGVDVDVMGYGPVPRGVKPGSILDRNFDWKCGGKCYYVKYEPGVHHMDGEHALAFIRARNANGGYGLPNSNFDREKNQQKVVNALVSKMMTVGTLTDYSKFSKILDAVGDNLRTNFSSEEVRSAIDLAKKTKVGAGRSITLTGNGVNLLTTGSLYGKSSVYPKAGLFDYTLIRKYVTKSLLDAGLSEEAARVGVFNASGEPGAAQKLADKFKDGNINVVEISNATKTCSPETSTAIVVLNDTKPKTLARLRKLSGGRKVVCQLEFEYDKTLDFVVIINNLEANK